MIGMAIYWIQLMTPIYFFSFAVQLELTVSISRVLETYIYDVYNRRW